MNAESFGYATEPLILRPQQRGRIEEDGSNQVRIGQAGTRVPARIIFRLPSGVEYLPIPALCLPAPPACGSFPSRSGTKSLSHQSRFLNHTSELLGHPHQIVVERYRCSHKNPHAPILASFDVVIVCTSASTIQNLILNPN